MMDGIKIKGRVRLTIRDAATGEVIKQTPWQENLVTTAGTVRFAELMRGGASQGIAFCGVGDDDTPAAAGDTELGNELGRLPITDTSISTATVTYSTFFGSADCNGTWKEEGLMTEAVNGVLVCHFILASPEDKNATKTITVDHELEVS